MFQLCPQLDATWPPHACAALRRQGKACTRAFAQRVLGDRDEWPVWKASFDNEGQARTAVEESIAVLEELAQQTPSMDFLRLVFSFRHEALCRLYPEPPEHFIRMGEADLILDILRQGLGRNPG